MSRSTPSRVGRRLLLYLGLSLALLAVSGLLVAISLQTGVTFTGGWIGLIGYTSMLFGIVIAKSKGHWRKSMFWVTVVGFLGVHLLVFVTILHRYPQWRMIWFWPVIVVEATLIGAVLDGLLGPPTGNNRAREQ